MTSNRMDKLVANYYMTKDRHMLSPPSCAQYQMNYSNLGHVSGHSKTRYEKFFIIPLVFYTYSNEKMNCDINPKVLSHSFCKKLKYHLDQEYYKLKLEGRKLEIVFSSMPNTINHQYKNQVVFIPSQYYFNPIVYSKKEEFSFAAGDLLMQCKVKDYFGNVIKEFDVQREIQPIFYETEHEGMRKDFIYFGLDKLSAQYDDAYEGIVMQILDELSNGL